MQYANMRIKTIVICAAPLIMLYSAFSGAAQESDLTLTIGSGDTGILKGTVVDVPDGAPIKDADIACQGPDEIEMEVKTDAAGKFEIKDLPPGSYILNIRKRGYRDRGGILRTVQAGTPTLVAVKMRKETTMLTYLARLARLARLDWVYCAPLLLFSAAGIVGLGVWAAGKAKGQQ